MAKMNSRRIAGLAASLALLGALGACGSAHSAARPGMAGGGTASPGGTAAGSSQPGTGALYAAVTASGTQDTAGAQFTGLEKSLESTGLARCMQKDGYRQATPEPTATATAEVVDNEDFPDLAQIARTGLAGPALRPEEGGLPPAPGTMTTAETKTYNADEQHCSQAPEKPFGTVQADIGALTTAWQPTVTRAESSPAVEAALPGFWNCARKAGMPAQPDPGHPLVKGASSADYFGAFLGYLDGPESSAKTQAASDAIDKHWSAIFVRCAQPVTRELYGILLPARQTFLRDHSQQARALEQAADQAVATAEKSYSVPGDSSPAPER